MDNQIWYGDISINLEMGLWGSSGNIIPPIIINLARMVNSFLSNFLREIK